MGAARTLLSHFYMTPARLQRRADSVVRVVLTFYCCPSLPVSPWAGWCKKQLKVFFEDKQECGAERGFCADAALDAGFALIWCGMAKDPQTEVQLFSVMRSGAHEAFASVTRPQIRISAAKLMVVFRTCRACVAHCSTRRIKSLEMWTPTTWLQTCASLLNPSAKLLRIAPVNRDSLLYRKMVCTCHVTPVATEKYKLSVRG